MNTWLTTRYQSAFESVYESTSTFSSEARHGADLRTDGYAAGHGITQSGYSYTNYSQNSGTTHTYEQKIADTETGTTSFTGSGTGSGTVALNFSESERAEYAYTSVVVSGYSSASTGVTSTGSHSSDGTFSSVFTIISTSVMPTMILETSTTVSYARTYNTTTSYTIPETVYTSGISGAKTVLSTTDVVASYTSDAVVAITTYDDGDGFTYTDSYATPASSSSLDSVFTTTTVTHAPFTGYIEYGTVISATGDDWLWSYKSHSATSLNTAQSFLTDIADSFTKTTFWPSYGTSTLSYSTFDYTTALTITFGASSRAITTNSNSLTDNITTTVTVGDMLQRSTTTAQAFQSTLSTWSFSEGYNSGSFTSDVSISTTTGLEQVYSTTFATNLNFVGLNFSTFRNTILTTTLVTVTKVTNPDGIYHNSESGTYSNVGTATGYTESGSYSSIQHKEKTITFLQGVDAASILASSKVFQRVAGYGGMQSPNAMQVTNGIGTNINPGATLYYPFSSSVRQNVVVPLPSNTTTNQVDSDKTAMGIITYGGSTYAAPIFTDVTKWKYQWQAFSLSYTKINTHTTLTSTSTITVSNSTTSTAFFNNVGTDSGIFWQSANVFGGFSPISTATELGVFNAGGVHATVYDTAGHSTTTKVIRSGISTSSLSGNIRVENAIPVYITNSGYGNFINTHRL